MIKNTSGMQYVYVTTRGISSFVIHYHSIYRILLTSKGEKNFNAY